jgi:hypothetical protein
LRFPQKSASPFLVLLERIMIISINNNFLNSQLQCQRLRKWIKGSAFYSFFGYLPSSIRMQGSVDSKQTDHGHETSTASFFQGSLSLL